MKKTRGAVYRPQVQPSRIGQHVLRWVRAMASVASMMVGQCGNQIGAAAYTTLYAERPFAGERALFGEGGQARAVLVDGEAKVVGA